MFGTFLNVGIVLHLHNINLADMVSVHDIFRAIPRIVQVHPPVIIHIEIRVNIGRKFYDVLSALKAEFRVNSEIF